jgi:Na+-transporting NADH:ubiquinone oxidoreductase subunit NqrB
MPAATPIAKFLFPSVTRNPLFVLTANTIQAEKIRFAITVPPVENSPTPWYSRVCYNLTLMQERDDTDVVVKLKSETRGVLNPQIVRWIAFVVITISLVACTVLCILAIWKFTESDAVWRAIATFIVVSIATAIFTLVNEKLG